MNSAELVNALNSSRKVRGYTHNYYRYPARFSPEFVREVIDRLTAPGETLLEPFMGGGTTVVEGLALARRVVGVDLNPLAYFIATVKTTPLSYDDRTLLSGWLEAACRARFPMGAIAGATVVNLPYHFQRFFAHLMAGVESLPRPRLQRFARCALLNAGQWALDGREVLPTLEDFRERLRELVLMMLDGMEEFVSACQAAGTAKNAITAERLLLCRSAVGLEDEPRIRNMAKRIKLVLTSPPYPGVHMLYHRWQVHGRRETAAPYWLASLKDGFPASAFTFGSRSTFGLKKYFGSICCAFASIRKMIADDALVVQLVAFADEESQLPLYLAAMHAAGFAEQEPPTQIPEGRVWRTVPHRRWYCRVKTENGSGKELLLFHRPLRN